VGLFTKKTSDTLAECDFYGGKVELYTDRLYWRQKLTKDPATEVTIDLTAVSVEAEVTSDGGFQSRLIRKAVDHRELYLAITAEDGNQVLLKSDPSKGTAVRRIAMLINQQSRAAHPV
jgi:hypothetical protein